MAAGLAPRRHPVFQKRLAEEGIDPKKEPNRAGAKWIDNVWHGRAWSWEKMPWLIKTWKEISGGKPFAIKGIQSVVDARKCVEIGCDGIVVSNHAGRQNDGAIASLDALEKIVDEVGDKTYIMYDSGIRGASDVVKALALGAKFVFVGRLWVWGLSIMGETGVRHVMKSLLADLDIMFNVAGIQSVDQLDRSWLESGPPVYSLIAEKTVLRFDHGLSQMKLVYKVYHNEFRTVCRGNSVKALLSTGLPQRSKVVLWLGTQTGAFLIPLYHIASSP
ncbi:FMN-dependent alpha-hydroxy acid dehydrogenase [Hortaea werneckii]|nr:FMN-dependent alpha-hydroxy acid dehydrogenase [Hortaea werneckii]